MEITGVSFEYPMLLWFLLAIPIFIGAHVYNLKLKSKEALLFSNFESLEHVMGQTFIPSYTLQIILNLIVFLLLVFAAAGMNVWYKGQVPKADFAIVIDNSASMSAEDISPSRMGAAKAVALSFIESLPPNSKVAIIRFAGTPFVEQPLTEDLSKAKEAVINLEVKSEGGTDIASALIAAINTLSVSEKPRVVILITDGSSTVGLSIKEGVDFAKSNHVIVHTVGVGTEAGGSILIKDDSKDTILNEATLTYIAGSTLGTYLKINNNESKKITYENVVESNLSRINIKLSPLLISMVLMLLGFEWILSFTKFARVP